MNTPCTNTNLIWKYPILRDAHMQEQLYEINDLCVKLIIDTEKLSDALHVSSADSVFIIRNILRELNSTNRAFAARCSFLLTDFRFQDPEWWQTIARHPAKTTISQQPIIQFPKQAAVELARSTLTFVWHATHLSPEFAVLSLGISPAIIETISGLRLQQIEKIASHQFRHVGPRWAAHPSIWKQLSCAAQKNNNESTAAFNLSALRLSAGELILNRRSKNG